MKKFTFFLSAMLFSLMSLATEVTVSIETYAAANGWKDATQYSSIAMDNIVTITATKTAGDSNNTGKYYVNGQNWRMYQTENPNIVVAAADGYVLTSVTFTYESNKTGIIIDAAGAQVVSEAAYALQNLSSATFGVGNSAAGVTNGQARVKAITVTYNVGEGGGDTPDTPDTPDAPDTPVTGTEITGIQGADATYVADEEFGDYWVFDLYASIDETEGMYMSPYLYVETYEAYGKTTLNGTYNIYYAEYWKNENEEDLVNTDEMAEEPVGTLTIKNKDNNGNYSFVGSFVGLDGKTYTLNQVVPVTAYEYLGQDEDGYDIYEGLTLSENGSTPDTPDTPNISDMLTCAQAATIAAADNYKGTDNVTVYGYVVELIKEKVDDKTGRNKQSFWMSDTKGGEKQFQAFYAFVPENFFKVGDQVAVTGILQNYKGTIEIADGEAVLLEVTTGVEDVVLNENLMKVIKNGQMYIIRDGKAYNVLGAQVK